MFIAINQKGYGLSSYTNKNATIIFEQQTSEYYIPKIRSKELHIHNVYFYLFCVYNTLCLNRGINERDVNKSCSDTSNLCGYKQKNSIYTMRIEKGVCKKDFLSIFPRVWQWYGTKNIVGFWSDIINAWCVFYFILWNR